MQDMRLAEAGQLRLANDFAGACALLDVDPVSRPLERVGRA